MNFTDKIKKNHASEALSPFQQNSKYFLNIAFSPLYGNSWETLGPIISNNGHKVNVVEKQANGLSKKSSKFLDPSNGKSFNHVERLARQKKSELLITVNKDNTKLGVGVKFQRRYKFFNSNQIASLYTDFILSKMKRDGVFLGDRYIVSTKFSSNLISKIADKFGVKVINNFDSLDNIEEITKKEKGKILFAFDQKNGIFIPKDGKFKPNVINSVLEIIYMVSYYKTQNVNLYDKLMELYKCHGIHRTVCISKKVSSDDQKIIFKKIAKAKGIAGKKVIDKENLSTGDSRSSLIIFKNGSWVGLKKENDNELSLYVENVGDSNQKLIDVVVFEKDVDDYIESLTEKFEDKHWSWRVFFKYLTFLSIVTAIMVFVFLFVYKNASGSNTEAFSVFHSIYNGVDSWIWLSAWVYVFFLKLVGAWAKKRMFDQLNEKVKMRHIFISQMMGAIIAFITPFAIGGDAIGYWYLRRKGVKRAPLIATLASATIWVEMKYALQTLFLFGIGINLYKEIFSNNNPEAHAALILFFVGLVWGIFSSSMIFILSTSRRVQEFIVRNSVKILEWLPFYHLTDPGLLESGTQRQFKMIRTGTKKIWKKPTFILEMVFYDIAPMFLSPVAIIYACSGVVNNNVASGPYWSQLVAWDIAGTANSMSLTPGGSGTWEWLNININEHLYNGSSFAKNNALNSKTIAVGVDLLSKVIFQWPDLVLSSLFILLAVVTIRKKPIRILRGNRKYYFIVPTITLAIAGLITMILVI